MATKETAKTTPKKTASKTTTSAVKPSTSSSKKGRGKAAKEALLKQKREQERLKKLEATQKPEENAAVTEPNTPQNTPQKPVKIKESERKVINSKKLRSGNPAKRGEVIADYLQKKETAVAKPVKLSKDGLNPAWLVPMLIGSFLIGIAWVVIFYMTANIGGYPIPAIGYGNFVAGFGFILLGFGFSTRWK